MKILVVHNAYQQRGGEDSVVAQETELLGGAGHEVMLARVSNDDITSGLDKVKAFIKTPYNSSRARWMAKTVHEWEPDVVHVHNFFPLLSPSIHDGAAGAGAAVVQTLHNYRTVCASALLLRNGRPCEKCLTGDRLWGVVHRCYRGSALASLAIARMQLRADQHRTWHRKVHRFIALTEFSRQKFISGGFPADRIAVKPNFITHRPEPRPTSRGGALFVGRLSPEKGAKLLLEAWKGIGDVSLTVVGSGPQADELRAQAPQNVVFTGELPPSQVKERMNRASMLIVPSMWYEGFPMVLLEAFAAGLPVIASRIGSLAELVVPGQNGDLFQAGNVQDLRQTVTRWVQKPDELRALGRKAREISADRYSPEQNLTRLEAIYHEAMAVSRADSLVGARQR